MSYRVEYPCNMMSKRRQKKTGLRLPLLISLFFILFLLVLNVYYPHGQQVMRQVFLAGGGEELICAVQNFTDSLAAGGGLSQAVQTFCRELVVHGN